MFPKTFVDKTECLQSLVGVRTHCSVEDQYPFWIEDIAGVDVKKLASMAKASNPSGKDFANQLINTAARLMMGDLELMLNNGYKMQNIVGDMCSTCTLLANYTVNTGIVIKSAVSSSFQIMRISKLVILTNHTGTKELVIDDGVAPQTFNIDLVAGDLMPVLFDYSTTQKSVKVYFTDPTVALGQVTCQTTSSCGCGGSTTSHNPVHIKGLAAGIETTNQYGFLPCVAIDCSYDALVCGLIKQTPNIFGAAMLFKVGELYHDNKLVSDRNNDAVAFNDQDEPKEEKNKNYGRLYWAKMKGTNGMSSITKIVNDYLKTKRADRCVICEAKIMTAYATG
jgi:hypothetical protein